MKNWRSICIVILMAVLVVGVDRSYQFGLMQNRNLKTEWLKQDPNEYDILFHGPCEVIWTIDPEIIQRQTGKSCYNLSQVHADFANNFLSLYLFLKYHQAPEKLFLFVTPESMDERFNVFYPHHFTTEHSDEVVRGVMKSQAKSYAFWMGFPWLRYAYFNQQFNFNALQGLKHWRQNKKEPHFANGYVPPLKMKWDNHYEELFKLYPTGITFQWSSSREIYLEKIIALCKAYKIDLTLYESPVLATATPNQTNRKEMLERIDSIAKYHEIEYWVFDTLPMCKDQNLFFSALNPNYKGGQLFSEIIGNKVKKTYKLTND